MNKSYKQDFLRAGSLAREVRTYGKSLIKKGASYNETISRINKKIHELGGVPAFPPQIALNDVAAHYLPNPGEDIIFSDELVKLDIGVCYKGAIGDCAVTVDLSGKWQKLVDAVEAALLAAEESIEVGLPVREIGKIIEDTIDSYGFTSVKNLTGHGLGYYKIHTSPAIPNFYDDSKAIIKPGMTFAIEPFGTNGKGLIYEEGDPMIFVLGKRPPAPTGTLKLLLAKMESFQGLPFAVHNLISDELSLLEIKIGLAELVKAGIVMGYGPLIEEARGMVAQAENSVLVDESGKVFITTR